MGILGWREAESFRSQSDFPGVQHCYDICRSLVSWLLLEQPVKTSWQPTLSSITLEESRQVSFKSPYMASCAEVSVEKRKSRVPELTCQGPCQFGPRSPELGERPAGQEDEAIRPKRRGVSPGPGRACLCNYLRSR